MNSQASGSSPFELNFRLFWTPICIQPSYWFMSLLFGYFCLNTLDLFQRNPFYYLAIWAVAHVLSIMIHEFGHVFVGKMFGEPGAIVLQSFGGGALGQYDRLSPWKQILIAMAGPGAGFLTYFIVQWIFQRMTNVLIFDDNRQLRDVVVPFMRFMVLFNLIWGFFNLLPIYPLDGGNVLKAVCVWIMPRNGFTIAMGLSMLFALSIVVYSILKVYSRDLWYPYLDPVFNAIVFGMMAVQNFATFWSSFARERRSEWEEKPW